MRRRNYLLRVAGLSILFLLLSAIAAIAALYSLNIIPFAVAEHWDQILRNVG